MSDLKTLTIDTRVRRDTLLAAVVFVVLAGLPLVGEPYWLRLGTTVLMYAVLALSWNFIGGMAGYPSFATAAFSDWVPTPVGCCRNSGGACGSPGALPVSSRFFLQQR